MSGDAPLATTFAAMAPKGSIATYEWDFKDNTPVAQGASVQHTFMGPGSYDVTLTVKDSKGNFNKASLKVTAMPGATG
ncbi:MAG: PKD domain-containing protein, partial [Burkholderiaceae bacterium]